MYSSNTLLVIENLSISFQSSFKRLEAVRNLDFEINASTITCLVGESGCGKSLTCKAILRLTPGNALLSGSIFFNNIDLLTLSGKDLCKIRGAEIGMIFQEPMTSLNPVLPIGKQCTEPLIAHLGLNQEVAKAKVIELFSRVGIPAPEKRYNDYPHQLSGGMRQRVMIAMALSCQPQLLLADEPTTALDATIQGQILRLIVDESRQNNSSVLLISHDLGIVADVADYVGVMYAGTLVEYATCQELFMHPLHPYSQGLINSAPSISSMNFERLPTINGTVPSIFGMPQGCPFHPRCPNTMEICQTKLPVKVNINCSHSVACWLYIDQMD